MRHYSRRGALLRPPVGPGTVMRHYTRRGCPLSSGRPGRRNAALHLVAAARSLRGGTPECQGVEGRRAEGRSVTGRPSGWPAREEDRRKPAYIPCFRDAALQQRGCGCVSVGRCRASRTGRARPGWPVRPPAVTRRHGRSGPGGAVTPWYRAPPGAGAHSRRGERPCPTAAARLPRPVRPIGGNTALPRPGPYTSPPEPRRGVRPRGAIDRDARGWNAVLPRRPPARYAQHHGCGVRPRRPFGRATWSGTSPGTWRYRTWAAPTPGDLRTAPGLITTDHRAGCNARLRRPPGRPEGKGHPRQV